MRLGFKGKLSIHPNQIEAINRIFRPTIKEVEYAWKVVRAYEEAMAHGKGAVAMDGKMIDEPVVKRARDLIARNDAITRQEAQKGASAT